MEYSRGKPNTATATRLAKNLMMHLQFTLLYLKMRAHRLMSGSLCHGRVLKVSTEASAHKQEASFEDRGQGFGDDHGTNGTGDNSVNLPALQPSDGIGLLPYAAGGSEQASGTSSSKYHPWFLVVKPGYISMTFLVVALAVLYVTWTFAGETTAVDLGAGVGKLPFMGYNTWNAYYCNINETIVMDTAKYMKDLGLLDVGYNWVNLDDCYSEKNRSASGDIIANKERFPSGMKSLTKKINKMGFKAGIYSDSGWFTCQLYPGSFQNEDRDIKLFQDWGFELLKYDNCAVPHDAIVKENIIGKYTRMSNAIKNLSLKSGKPPILFSLCEWGRQQPWIWAKRLGQSWRTTDDIGANWYSLSNIINQNSFYAQATDFYGRNDLDILEVGNGDMTYDEAKSHFTAWALMKSPLLISTDLSSIKPDMLSILKNEEIIAINQDPVVGTAITPFRWGINPDWTYNRTHPAVFWSGESQNGTVFMLLNVLDHPTDLWFSLTESPWIRAGRQYAVRDLWTHTENGTVVRNFTAKAVPPHGVVALLLTDAGDEPEGTMPPCAVPEWCMSQNDTQRGPY